MSNGDVLIQRLDRVEGGLAELKTDVAELRTDMTELQTGQSDLREKVIENGYRKDELLNEVRPRSGTSCALASAKRFRLLFPAP